MLFVQGHSACAVVTPMAAGDARGAEGKLNHSLHQLCAPTLIKQYVCVLVLFTALSGLATGCQLAGCCAVPDHLPAHTAQAVAQGGAQPEGRRRPGERVCVCVGVLLGAC